MSNDYEYYSNNISQELECIEYGEWILCGIIGEYCDFLLNKVIDGHELREIELFF